MAYASSPARASIWAPDERIEWPVIRSLSISLAMGRRSFLAALMMVSRNPSLLHAWPVMVGKKASEGSKPRSLENFSG